MLSHGNALVHSTPECELAHDSLVAMEMAQDMEMAGRAFYKVFTDETAASRRACTRIGPRFARCWRGQRGATGSP
eukprot:6555319-Prymnesium_polylepis.1